MTFEANNSSVGKQRLIDIKPDEMWTDFLEQINDLMIEEKAARQVFDHIKLAEICTRIVSLWIQIQPSKWLNQIFDFF